MWVSVVGCVVGRSLLGCVVLVWFWVPVAVDFVWWVSGTGFASVLGFGFLWMCLCCYEFPELVVAAGFLVFVLGFGVCCFGFSLDVGYFMVVSVFYSLAL